MNIYKVQLLLAFNLNNSLKLFLIFYDNRNENVLRWTSLILSDRIRPAGQEDTQSKDK